MSFVKEKKQNKMILQGKVTLTGNKLIIYLVAEEFQDHMWKELLD